MNAELVLNILSTGLLNTGIYGLLTIGFCLIFGVARILNFAHTAFYMVAAYLIYIFTRSIPLGVAPAIIISIVGTTLLGLILAKVVLDPIREHETAVIIATVAIAFIFQEIFDIAYGGQYLATPAFIPGYVDLLGVRIMHQQLLTLGVAVIVILFVYMFLLKSRVGLTIRVVSQDREIAGLMGIDVGRVYLIVIGMASAFVAIAGAFVAPLYCLSPTMWLPPLVIIIAAVFLGGLGSIKGSIIGAAVLAFTESLVVYLIPIGSFLKTSVALAIIGIVLIVKPEGLFGIVFEEERL